MQSQMETKSERLSALRDAALAGKERCDLKSYLNNGREHGLSPGDIASAIAGSDWRYEIKGSGLEITIAHRDEIMTALVDGLAAFKSKLTLLEVQDLTDAKPLERLSQTRIRMNAARAARAYDIAAIRLGNFLLPEEGETIDIEAEITNALSAHGFEWNGGDAVMEIWTEEHERISAENERVLRARGALQ